MMICFFNNRNQVAETLVLIGSRCVRNLLRKSVSGCFFPGEFHMSPAIQAVWLSYQHFSRVGFNEAKPNMFTKIFLLQAWQEAYFCWFVKIEGKRFPLSFFSQIFHILSKLGWGEEWRGWMDIISCHKVPIFLSISFPNYQRQIS